MTDLMQTRSRPLPNTRLLLPLICAFTQLTAGADDVPKTVEVKTARPARGEIIRYVTLPGSIRANQQATLYAKVPGYLKSIAVDKGNSVTNGQALGEIEVPELLADQHFDAVLKLILLSIKFNLHSCQLCSNGI